MESPNKIKEASADPAIAGAVSGFITRFLCQPLDVLKIRFQLQVEPISRHYYNSKYTSMSQAFQKLLKEEGVKSLWKGHVPAQSLSIVYGMTQFYSYDTFMKMLKRSKLEDWNNSIRFIAGATAGSVATIVSFPFDTIRTRLVAQSSNYLVYNGMLHSCRSILQKESPRTFFYGLSPTLLQIAPHTGLQFVLYGFFTDLYKKYCLDTETSFYNSMISGASAGLIAKTIVYPFDLARKRLQIQGFQHGRTGFGKFFRCNGLMNCLKVTIREEGLLGLFKGLVPSQVKGTAATALHFTVYEQVILLLKIMR